MNENQKENIQRVIRKFYVGNKINYALSVFLMVVDAGFNVILAFFMQQIFDVAVGGTVGKLLEITGIAAVFTLALVLVTLAIRYFYNMFMKKAMAQYKNYIFEQITEKNINAFIDDSTGRYISMLTNDMTIIEEKYVKGTIDVVVQIATFVMAFCMMLIYSWQMSLFVIIVTSIPMITSMVLGKKIAELEKNVSKKNETFVGTIKDLLSGFTVIKSFRAEKEVQTLFNKQNDELEELKRKRKMREYLLQMTIGILSFVCQMSVFVYGAYLSLNGVITSGVVIAFVQLMNFVLNPIRQIPVLLANRKAAYALIEKSVTLIFKKETETGTEIINNITSGISFEHVTFGYDTEETILKNLDLQIDAGKSYALVGASGSGKSTILNLLLGSYHNYKGKINLDSHELRDITTDSLYNQLSVVQQNVFVFDNTIHENITMFKIFEQDAINNAIKKAGLNDLLEKRGNTYACGENGSGLSGGEKQRISIARSLLRNTPVLLMDEATSALDTETSLAVEEAILSIDGMTRVIVTHKLHERVLQQYDEIIVLSDGKIVEQGNFATLIGNGGHFHSLYQIANA